MLNSYYHSQCLRFIILIIDIQQVQVRFDMQTSLIVEISGLEYLTPKQLARKQLFYSFLQDHILINPDQMYFSRFIKQKINDFAIGKGFPIISKKCNSARCYFYIDISDYHNFKHDFLLLLNKEIKEFNCSNCKQIITIPNQFIYDVSLDGLLQIKLSNQQKHRLKTIKITNCNDVLKDENQDQIFKYLLNSASQLLKGTKEQNQTNIKIDTYNILQGLQKRLDCKQLTGNIPFKLGQDESHFYQNTVGCCPIMTICHLYNGRGAFYMFKQISQENTVIPVRFQSLPPINEQVLSYYDSDTLTYYSLTRQGILYKCDFKCMYNMNKNIFYLRKVHQIEPMPDVLFRKCYSKLVVRDRKLYLFSSNEKDQFIRLYKAIIPTPQNYVEKIMLHQILQQKIPNRKGYSVSWVNPGHLIKQNCMVVYGGSFEMTTSHKIMQVIIISQLMNDRYYQHKIDVTTEQCRRISCCHAIIAVLNMKLIVLGGVVQNHTNKYIIIIPIKNQGKPDIIIKQIKIDEQINQNTPIATYLGQRSVFIMSQLTKQGKFHVIKIRNPSQNYVNIQCLKLEPLKYTIQ